MLVSLFVPSSVDPSEVKMLRKIFISILLLVVSFSFSGCSLPGWNSASTPPQSEVKPIEPAPVSTDGVRTSYADTVERVVPAVVVVTSEIKATESRSRVPSFEDFFKGDPGGPSQPQQRQRGFGSGVIVSGDGTIVTNHHVIAGASKIKIELNDKRTFEAKVVGSDEPTDLAVLKIEAAGLPFLTLGDSDKARVGDIILAIGNPLGIGQSVTAGIISAKGRRTGLGDGSFEDFLQIDAPINRGNSGGALVSLTGELIGINSQILSTSGGNIGIGFSIPSNMAKSVMEQLLKNGKVSRGQLGVGIQTVTEDLAKTMGLKDNKGVIVGSVRPGSSADKAGVKRGDVIVAINGEATDDGNALRNKVAATAPGTTITLTLIRNEEKIDVKATLDEFQPAKPEDGGPGGTPNAAEPGQSGKLGVNLQPLTAEIAKRLELPAESKGMVVTEIDPSGPAASEGIAKGDVILEINRQPVETFEDVQSALAKSVDRPALLLIARRGQTVFVTVELNK